MNHEKIENPHKGTKVIKKKQVEIMELKNIIKEQPCWIVSIVEWRKKDRVSKLEDRSRQYAQAQYIENTLEKN